MSEIPLVNPPVFIARGRNGYCIRMLLVAFGMWVASGWFMLDAGIRYPHENKQWEKVRSFQKEHGQEAALLWPRYANANGFNENYNNVAKEELPHTGLDISTQWGIAGFTLLMGAVCLAAYLTTRRQFVRLEGTGENMVLSNHTGLRLHLAQIDSMDASHWEDKGKAVVIGKTGQIKLDDWKMDTEPMNDIFHALVNEGVRVNGLAPSSTDPTHQSV